MVSLNGAEQAVTLVPQIVALQTVIAEIQAAITAGGSIISLSAQLNINGTIAPLNGMIAMSPTDTATVLNAVVASLQTQLTNANTALAALT